MFFSLLGSWPVKAACKRLEKLTLGNSRNSHEVECGHQVSISSTFYARFFCQYFGAKKFQTQNRAL